jgi:hypothetical protein
MSPGVREALDRVYRALASPTPQSIEACPCCVSESQVQLLLSRPLREISPVELTEYASAVLLTSGDIADFRYFLPRILEISLTERWWWPDIEVTLSKLTMAGWDSWPTAERHALMNVFERAFDEAVETSSSNPLLDIDSWLCGLGLAGVDLEPFLKKLEDPAAAQALLPFIRCNDQYRQHRTLANPFWDKDRAASDRVVDWLHSTRGQSAIARATALKSAGRSRGDRYSC